jgi:hypothetical protein
MSGMRLSLTVKVTMAVYAPMFGHFTLLFYQRYITNLIKTVCNLSGIKTGFLGNMQNLKKAP